ncbi:MAG TPA: GNAT family N-acetyltransferase [Mesorhizobium sp.]|uniref:GNAT family N-acetyltransferase n=1 Tax=Mesorhizobium sp. TaxID=1871066 RepID=UPI002DDD4176|nr:GNAT family N-acetyltransferase [Mesorhizobium sp.]HEV2503189.1 GNAT family N-acetyltransferase [Mesorhizobium sp.]
MTVVRRSLRTERLVLRPTIAADADQAFAIQSDWDVTRMLRMASFPPDLEEIRQWFHDQPREWLAGEAYRFAVEQDGRMIGLVDIDEIAGGVGSLGYWFDRAAWGQGFAVEAARSPVRFAREDAGLEGLKSGHAADNVASGRVLAKLGFCFIDTVEVFSRSRGEMIDQRRYALNFTT